MTDAQLKAIADQASLLLGRPGSISMESVRRVLRGDVTPGHPADEAILFAAKDL